MTLVQILIFAAIALLVGVLRHPKLRSTILFIVSVLAVFALQPDLPIRGLDFWLPLATLAFVTISWFISATLPNRDLHHTLVPLLILATIILVLGLTRYIDINLPLPVSRPPQIHQIFIAIVILSLVGGLLLRLPGWIMGVMSIFLILILIVLKSPQLAEWTSSLLRSVNQQSAALASALDIKWLGFSYISFRIIHTLRDRKNGRLSDVSLMEYITYVVFFPALTAGPIHRIERFIEDLRHPTQLKQTRLLNAGQRLGLGLFKKFVLADCLALIALNGNNALQVQQAGWMWLLVYAYAFQLLFDFSGYTDIAIGIGQLAGIQLPENFNSPYLKHNLTQFWNNWHMSLTQWFRAYFFNPLTRTLRRKNLPIPLILLITQLATMLLIGLWHGITLNFVFWGLWHGLGLFINNRWQDKTKLWMENHINTTSRRMLANIGGVLLTFHFVVLGWVFFALPDIPTSWHVFLTLFGGQNG